MTPRQKEDIASIKYFIPKEMKKKYISAEAIKDFFNFSDRGIRPTRKRVGFEVLSEGKRWRGIHIGMYEEGILEGTMPYSTICYRTPKAVIKYLAKELFSGTDKEKLMNYLKNGREWG